MDALGVEVHVPVAFAIGVQVDGGSARRQKVMSEYDEGLSFDHDESMAKGLALEQERNVYGAARHEGLAVRSYQRLHRRVRVSGDHGVDGCGLEGFGGDEGEGGAGVGETFSGVRQGTRDCVIAPVTPSRSSFAQEPKVLEIEGLRADVEGLRLAGEIGFGMPRGGGSVVVGAGAGRVCKGGDCRCDR